MFIYADETGNSGRNIFDENEYFRLGGLMTVSDIAPQVAAVLQPFLAEHGKDRLHAHEWPEEKIASLGHAVLDAIDGRGSWAFSLTEIHKPYMAPTKFVDVIFDAGENKNVPGHWYWDELNRHVLCLTIDAAMTVDTAKTFWKSYLDDDVEGILKSLESVWDVVTNADIAPVVRDVIKDGFAFARVHPEEFTITHTEKRRGYQVSTPNVVAFTHLFQAIHDFAAREDSLPEALVHDKQDEFRKALAETYKNFGSVIWRDSKDGFPEITLADYELATFEMPSSKDNAGLQATDLILWTLQRHPKTAELASLKERIKSSVTDYEISRRMSRLIVHVRLLAAEQARGARKL